MTGIEIFAGVGLGLTAYILLRALMLGFFTVAPNERAVLTSFGRAQRISKATTLDTPLADDLPASERGPLHLSAVVRDRAGRSLFSLAVAKGSEAWGFHLGSVYIRKVHFRDSQMIQQIEQKIVNRLRQVTSAIRQQGANQVAIIKSGAERTAAAEFAHASAVRPYLVGKAIQEIAKDKEILDTVFEILETERALDGEAELSLIPRDNLFARLLIPATQNSQPVVPAPQ